MKLELYGQDETKVCEFEVVSAAPSETSADEDTTTLANPLGMHFTSALALDANEAEIEADVEEMAPAFCDEITLAAVSGIPEVKIEYEKQCVGSGWAKVCWRVPVAYSRTSRQKLILRYCVDSKPALKLVKECAQSAAIAGVASAFANPASILPVVKAALTACLVAKGKQSVASSLSLKVRVESESGQWKRRS